MSKTSASQLERNRKHRQKTKNAATKKWRKNNPQKWKITKDRNRRKTVLRKQGWTLQEYENAKIAQENKCWLCRREFADFYGRRPCADHNHETGNKRALICDRCNRLEGWIKQLDGEVGFETWLSNLRLYYQTFK